MKLILMSVGMFYNHWIIIDHEELKDVMNLT